MGFYTGQNSMAAPQMPVRPGGGDLGAAPPSGGGANSRPGSGAWPPADVSLNLNKAITKRLANATHYQQLLDIISDSAMYFDEVLPETNCWLAPKCCFRHVLTGVVQVQCSITKMQ